ncbi:MAG: DUF427 domain-containing protein [Crocosphaera sp.]
MAKAIWNDVILADSQECEIVEGNYYFPPDSINKDYFKESNTHSNCFWKGQANYYTLDVNGKENKDAAWYYPTPKEKAQNIKGYVAFWKGVQVEK